MSKFVEADERHMAFPAASTHAAHNRFAGETAIAACASLGRPLVRVWPEGW